MENFLEKMKNPSWKEESERSRKQGKGAGTGEEVIMVGVLFKVFGWENMVSVTTLI